MNARSIHRRLRRNATSVFWGKRAFITLRLPQSIFPSPYPTLVAFGLQETNMGGFWEKRYADGTIGIVAVQRLSSGRDPRKSDDPRDRDAIFIAEDSYGGFSWWEVHESRGKPKRDEIGGFDYPDKNDPSFRVITPKDPEGEWLMPLAKKVYERDQWERYHLQGYRGPDGKAWYEVSDLGRKLQTAVGRYPKTYYLDEDPKGDLLITLSVKTVYPSRMHGCASDVRALLSHLKRIGHPVRYF